MHEAILEASSENVPVLCWVDDNRLAISTDTRGKTMLDHASHGYLHSIPVTQVSAGDVVGAMEAASEIISIMREDRRPHIIRANVTRIDSHSNADDDSRNRCAPSLVDPVEILHEQLIHWGVSSSDLNEIERTTKAKVESDFHACLEAPGKVPPLGQSKRSFRFRSQPAGPTGHHNIRETLNALLRKSLSEDSRIVLIGQDIEGPKGGVFGVTRGLSSDFPDRVKNAPLSESTIVGTCVGRALAGQRPIAFIQLADLLPLALNQILNEMSTMYWRTNGDWQAPVTIIASAGGYRAGTGPIHSGTLILYCPRLRASTCFFRPTSSRWQKPGTIPASLIAPP